MSSKPHIELMTVSMRVAYADPPYPGKAAKHYRHRPDYGGEVDHPALIQRLIAEFPDGWALSTNSSTLRVLLPLCPPDVRVGAWVKPFAWTKKGVHPVYAWEPLIFRGGRKRGINRGEGFIAYDWVRSSPMMDSGVKGRKPEEFAFWLFRMLNLREGDEFVDLFPGSGAVTWAWEKWQRQLFAA
jgi:hypothetical protein